MSRVKNAIKNSIFGIVSFIFITIGTFISRKIFANALGSEYLGLMGLFTNILTMICLSEFGISATTIFFLYEPLVKKDNEKIKSILNFTKKMYNTIALVVFIIGIITTCFIDKIAHGSISPSHIRWYFILSLINSVVSYLFYYKQTLLIADQKNYIISIIHTILKLASIILQIIVLIVFKSFALYLFLQIIATILENIFCSYMVNKKYPYIKNKSSIRLDKVIKLDMYKKTKALFINKLSGFIVFSTDNIIISIFINLFEVGIYSNYMLIISMIKALFSQIFSAFTTGFGDIIAQKENEHAYIVFKASLFFSFCISSVASILLLVFSKKFIYLWLGEKYLLPFTTVCLIAVSLYTSLMDVAVISVQNATALHYKDQEIMIIQIIVNLVLSFVFVQSMGIFGVVLANIVSNTLLPSISKPYIVYKYVFEKSCVKYFKKYLYYSIVTFIMGIITFFVSNYFFKTYSILSLLCGVLICSVICLFVIIIFFCKTDEYKYCKGIIITIFDK